MLYLLFQRPGQVPRFIKIAGGNYQSTIRHEQALHYRRQMEAATDRARVLSASGTWTDGGVAAPSSGELSSCVCLCDPASVPISP